MRLSVLDLVPVRSDQSSSDAVAATVALAQAADRAGFTRYWVAEHHNMPAVAATSPPVLIAMLAAQTERIRLGSGGVMLPNHAPLAVAEQFALLEAATPGRIDLGIGRAPGSDPVTSMALRGPAGRDDTDVEKFPQYLDDVVALMGAERRPRGDPAAGLRPQGHAGGRDRAQLVAARVVDVLRPVSRRPRACRTCSRTTSPARAPLRRLATYRAEFQPSDVAAEPTTFLTVNAVVAESAEPRPLP